MPPQECFHEFTTGLMSLDTALNEMLSRVTPLTAQETLPLVQCFGRILASDVVSPLDVPGFDNSAMDGYAVRLADIASRQPLPVAGKSLPVSRTMVNGLRVPAFVL